MLAHTGNFEGARRWAGCASTEGRGVLAVPYDIPHSSVAKRQETLGTHILRKSPPSLPLLDTTVLLTCVSYFQWWCPAFLSPALATNTSVPRPTFPTRYSRVRPASPPPLLPYKSAASRAQLIASASGYLCGADHGERRDGDGARTRHRLPPGLCAELVVLLCGGGRLGR